MLPSPASYRLNSGELYRGWRADEGLLQIVFFFAEVWGDCQHEIGPALSWLSEVNEYYCSCSYCPALAPSVTADRCGTLVEEKAHSVRSYQQSGSSKWVAYLAEPGSDHTNLSRTAAHPQQRKRKDPL